MKKTQNSIELIASQKASAIVAIWHQTLLFADNYCKNIYKKTSSVLQE